MRNEPSTAEWSARYWNWLTEAALPLWSQAGLDRSRGGFQELLDLDGTPFDSPRRARVQGRQSFVFAFAGTLGWNGPWAQIAPIGLDYLEQHYRRPDGLYSTLADPDGVMIDPIAMTYDQAFALLAAAALKEQGRGPGEAYALTLMTRIAALRGHPQGGFVEADGRFLSNPHMHMFEAALAWMQAGQSPVWEKTAGAIVTLALRRFIDPERRVLREVFDADWAPAAGDAGQVVEPGHQFEWAWLLERWARAKGDAAAHDAARALFAAGLRGIDPARRAAVDRTDPDMVTRRATARLWPQTEWLKAACILDETAQTSAAAASLWRYLDTPKVGLWRDKMREDGTFVEEPVPASSLYHIICAVASLKGLI